MSNIKDDFDQDEEELLALREVLSQLKYIDKILKKAYNNEITLAKVENTKGTMLHSIKMACSWLGRIDGISKYTKL